MFTADFSALLPAAGFFAVLAERELERLAGMDARAEKNEQFPCCGG
jgi:hypothetical protein